MRRGGSIWDVYYTAASEQQQQFRAPHRQISFVKTTAIKDGNNARAAASGGRRRESDDLFPLSLGEPAAGGYTWTRIHLRM